MGYLVALADLLGCEFDICLNQRCVDFLLRYVFHTHHALHPNQPLWSLQKVLAIFQPPEVWVCCHYYGSLCDALFLVILPTDLCCSYLQADVLLYSFSTYFVDLFSVS